ncbi:cytochrome b [Meridianimarinicoccus aquatilis]|uniref:Cytochrome b n=1 Tax=Meridianimarinicoccus aquatilis TaxID=2552766 RepID=A0A4R6B149_9RHOB|nr:cytochrome b [Fluviibacterium aquatile]TDL90871.1 cytochrome b [Fluviibacterium aquatile]
MTRLTDSPDRYGLISRAFHWSMAALFAAQFVSAAAHWALPRENALRETLWTYHVDLGVTLLLLVLLRGVWGLWNLSKRATESGPMGYAAKAGHAGLYALMVIVPAIKIIGAAGGTRGFSYLGIQVFPARDVAIAWTKTISEWHGTLGWILAALVIGHIAAAVIWHHFIKRDDVLARMA